MIKKIKNKIKPELINTGLIFGVSTFIKLMSGLIIAKLIVLSIGLEGFGIISQLQSVMNILMVFAGGGIANGIVKYVAEHKNSDKIKLNSILQTSTLITIVFGCIIGILLLVFSQSISEYLFKTKEYSNVFIILGILQFFIGFNTMFQSILNGYIEIKNNALSSVLGSITGLIIVYFLSKGKNISSIMISQILFGFFTSFFCILFLYKKPYFNLSSLKPKFDKTNSKLLLKYSLMLIVTISTIPIAQIMIRNIIGEKYGWDAVGKWQGVMKISDAYLQFITIVLTNYFFPKLAGLKNKESIKNEIISTLKIIIPITIFISFIIFGLRKYIILVLYDETFIEISDFFTFQLIGDVFKISAYTLIFISIARGLMFVYIIAEIFQALCLIFLSNYFMQSYGLIGVTYGYALTYLIYLIFSIVILYLFLKTNVLEKTQQL